MNRNSAIEMSIGNEVSRIEAENLLKFINRQMKRGRTVYLASPFHESSSAVVFACMLTWNDLRSFSFVTIHEEIILKYPVESTPMDYLKKATPSIMPCRNLPPSEVERYLRAVRQQGERYSTFLHAPVCTGVHQTALVSLPHDRKNFLAHPTPARNLPSMQSDSLPAHCRNLPLIEGSQIHQEPMR